MVDKTITFTSTITHDYDEQLVHKFVVQGRAAFDEKGILMRLDFPEPIEDGLTLETVLLVANDTLKIIREGAISMAQSFILGEAVSGTYQTEYGTFETRVYTSVFEVTGDEDAGEVYLVYDFYHDDIYKSKISLVIEYE